MPHAPLIEFAWLEPLGVLELGERRRLSAHLAQGCALCAAVLHASRRALEGLGASVSPMTPRDELRARVLESVGALDRSDKTE